MAVKYSTPNAQPVLVNIPFCFLFKGSITFSLFKHMATPEYKAWLQGDSKFHWMQVAAPVAMSVNEMAWQSIPGTHVGITYKCFRLRPRFQHPFEPALHPLGLWSLIDKVNLESINLESYKGANYISKDHVAYFFRDLPIHSDGYVHLPKVHPTESLVSVWFQEPGEGQYSQPDTLQVSMRAPANTVRVLARNVVYSVEAADNDVKKDWYGLEWT